MGIPLLLPWANRLGSRSFRVAGREVTLPRDPARVHEDGEGTPLHGVIPSLMRWQPAQADDARASARLDWTDPALLALFPFPHTLRYEAELAARALSVTITVSATHGESVPVAFGLHPYLRLVGAPRERWTVELPPCEQLELGDRMLPTGGRLPAPAGRLTLAERSFDDAFALTEHGGRFTARAGETRLSVELLEGFPFAQVFSPPEADFVCFEPMVSPTNALVSGEGLRVLAPGEVHTASLRLSVGG
jgi:galactose mutarotase-like enzyme